MIKTFNKIWWRSIMFFILGIFDCLICNQNRLNQFIESRNIWLRTKSDSPDIENKNECACSWRDKQTSALMESFAQKTWNTWSTQNIHLGTAEEQDFMYGNNLQLNQMTIYAVKISRKEKKISMKMKFVTLVEKYCNNTATLQELFILYPSYETYYWKF